MSADEFRDAIAHALMADGNVIGARHGADAVLAMPEMQVLRALAQVALDETAAGCPYLLRNGEEGDYGPNTCNQGCIIEPVCMTSSYPVATPAVLAWVLDGEP